MKRRFTVIILFSFLMLESAFCISKDGIKNGAILHCWCWSFKTIEEKLPEIKGEPDSLYGIHPFKRALIGFAGPFFNFIFAIIACAFMNGIGYTYYTYSNKILISDNLPCKEL